MSAATGIKWNTTASGAFPEKDRPIIWITPHGDEVRGRYAGGAVWLPEGSDVYVYYLPAYWRYDE